VRAPLVAVRRRWAVALLAGVLALSACGGQVPPSTAVPELGLLQQQVEQAVIAEDWDTARSGLDELVALAEAARGDGRLPATQVDDVVDAATGLAGTFPEPASPPASAPADDADDADESDDEGKGKGKGKGKDERDEKDD
jgi:hypothetical protein